MKSIRNRWINRPNSDWFSSGLLALGLEWLAWYVGSGSFLRVTGEARSALFQTLGATAGALLGFFITTVTILLVFVQDPGRRMGAALGDQRQEQTTRIFFGAIRAAFVSLIVFLVGAPYLLEGLDAAAEWVFLTDALLLGVALFLLLRTGRIIWLLHALTDVHRLDEREGVEGNQSEP